MNKKLIIVSSILVSIITLIIILFGVVFCLRKQYVTVLGNQPIVSLVQDENGEYNKQKLSSADIVKAAGFKKGKPIFMLDKQKAKENIESAYPMVKVVQIKTKSVISVEIIVRPRQETFYILTEGEKFNVTTQVYCIMDEELMAMDGEQYAQEKPERLNSLVELKLIDLNDMQNASTGIGKYFTSKTIREITSNLYNSFCSTIAIENGKIVADKTPNATRKDFVSVVKSVTLTTPSTDNKELNELVSGAINMTLSAKVNDKDFTINIAVAQKDLQYKINLCFNTLAKYLNSNEVDESKTTINCGYDQNHNIVLNWA